MTVDINLPQLLANTGAFLTCGSILGGFFARYAKSIGQGQIDLSLARFERDRLAPAIQKFESYVQEVADISGRVQSLQVTVKSQTAAIDKMSDTIDRNAENGRRDLTGVATRLELGVKAQTDLLVKLIEANRKP